MAKKPSTRLAVAAPGYIFRGSLEDVIDGDTVDLRLKVHHELRVDWGFRITNLVSLDNDTVQRFRLLGSNADEIATPAGKAAKKALQAIFAGAAHVEVRSVKDDKYGGRYLGDVDVIYPDGTVVNVVAELIKQGHAKKWNGKGVRPT